MQLLDELKRRKMFRVGAAYAVTAWLLMQVADLVLANFAAPAWIMRSILVVIAVGFPLALISAWAYDLSERNDQGAEDGARSARIGRWLNVGIMVILVLAVSVLLLDKFWITGDTRAAGRPGPEKSIAVLPFDDYTGSEGQAWFADGLAEEILNVLARTPDLLVASRTSSFRFRDSEHTVPEIADQLDVAHVLEGSVRRSPERIRVTVQLIRGDDGFHVWSKNYDREPSELIAIQEDIALSVARALETAMDPDALEDMMRAGTRSVDAYQQYLKGLALTSTANAEGSFETGRALEAFERAREIDSGFAEAAFEAAKLYREMSNTTVMVHSKEMSGEELRHGFRSSIQAAIDSAHDDVTRLKYESFQAEAQLRLPLAQEKLEQYLEARPNDLQSWTDYAYVSKKLGDREAVRRAVEERLERAPDGPIIAWEVAVDLMQINDVKAAAAEFEHALAVNPGDRAVEYQAHRGFLWAGRNADAEHLESTLLSSDMPDIYLSNVRLRGACAEGDRETAEAVLAAKPASDLYGRWHGHTLLGRPREAARVLMPLDETAGGRDDLAGYMTYAQFDPSRYPNFSRILDRRGIKHDEPVPIPFACPPQSDGSADGG